MDTPSPQQKVVIKHTEGSLLVIAGPGSGKIFTFWKFKKARLMHGLNRVGCFSESREKKIGLEE